jgi:hypothetical protein
MSTIKKSLAAIIRKIFTRGKKTRRGRKPSADGTFNRDAARRLQRHLQTARRRDTQPIRFSRGSDSHGEFAGQLARTSSF